MLMTLFCPHHTTEKREQAEIEHIKRFKRTLFIRTKQPASVVLYIAKGDYPEKVVFYPNKQCSFEPFVCLDFPLFYFYLIHNHSLNFALNP